MVSSLTYIYIYIYIGRAYSRPLLGANIAHSLVHWWLNMKSLYGVQANKMPFFQNMCPQKTPPCLQCSSVKNRPWQIYITCMLCICVYHNVWIFGKMCQNDFQWFSVYVSPQNKITRKSCSSVTDATTFPTPVGQPPKMFQIIHVNNWLRQNYYLKEILDELMAMPENGVTLARRNFCKYLPFTGYLPFTV